MVMSIQTKSTKMLNRMYKMLYQCDHCYYERNYKYNFRKHAKFQHEPTCCSSHCDYKKSDRKYMKNRHMLFQLYMHMKLQSTEVEDEENITY